MKTIAISTNIAWNLYNFRRGLANYLKERGYRIVMLAADDAYGEKLRAEGWHFVPLKNLERTGNNPVTDLLLYREYIKVLRAERVDMALFYNAKPLVYGCLAAKHLGIPYVPTITGLAGPFTGNRQFIAALVTLMYRRAFRSIPTVFFQNTEDQAIFEDKHIVRPAQCHLVEGSGVDMAAFDARHFPAPPDYPMVFFMFSRLSQAKGVTYYVEAARRMKAKYGDKLRFWLAGPVDSDKYAISLDDVQVWVKEGIVEYLGVSDNIKQEISKAHIIVYPSYYREGVPRSLIESAAMSRPIITTDNVGCREVVNDGENGYLVPPKDAAALADAIERLFLASPQERLLMGRASRAMAETRFDERIIYARYFEEVQAQLGEQQPIRKSA